MAAKISQPNMHLVQTDLLDDFYYINQEYQLYLPYSQEYFYDENFYTEWSDGTNKSTVNSIEEYIEEKNAYFSEKPESSSNLKILDMVCKKIISEFKISV